MYNLTRFEWGRLIKNRKIILIFSLFFISCIYFVGSGIFEYQSYKKEERNFKVYERLKSQQYLNYDQYGGFGFRIFYETSPLNILLGKGSFLKTTETSVNTRDIIRINNSRKGGSVFSDMGTFKGFSDFMLFFGSLFMLYMGVNCLCSITFIQHLQKRKMVLSFIFTRMFFTLFFLGGIFLLALMGVVIFGPALTEHELTHFLFYLFYTLLLFVFFYLAGILISLFTIHKKTLTFSIAFVTWLLLVIAIPEISNKIVSFNAKGIQSIEKINIKKLRTLMNLERRIRGEISKLKIQNDDEKLKVMFSFLSEYMKAEYRSNRKLEEGLMKEVEGVIKYLEIQSLFSPTAYHNFLSGEISSKGYYNYLGFVKYILDTKDEFVNFYIKKRYYSSTKGVTLLESFIKKDENIFEAKSSLPPTFWLGIAITFFYITILLWFSGKKIEQYLEDGKKKDFDRSFDFTRIRNGHIYFLFCKNQKRMNNIYRALRGNSTIYIERINPEDIPTDMTLKGFLNLTECTEKIEKEKVLKYLSILKLDNNILDKKVEDISFDTFKTFYCAVKFAKNKEYIIINDFVNGSGKKLSLALKDFLHYLHRDEEKTIVYISCEMFHTLSGYLKEMDFPNGVYYKLLNLNQINHVLL